MSDKDKDYPSPFDELGRDLIALGTALRDHDSKLETVVGLAMRCGLTLRFGLAKRAEVEHTQAAP